MWLNLKLLKMLDLKIFFCDFFPPAQSELTLKVYKEHLKVQLTFENSRMFKKLLHSPSNLIV